MRPFVSATGMLCGSHSRATLQRGGRTRIGRKTNRLSLCSRKLASAWDDGSAATSYVERSKSEAAGRRMTGILSSVPSSSSRCSSTRSFSTCGWPSSKPGRLCRAPHPTAFTMELSRAGERLGSCFMSARLTSRAQTRARPRETARWSAPWPSVCPSMKRRSVGRQYAARCLLSARSSEATSLQMRSPVGRSFRRTLPNQRLRQLGGSPTISIR
mmetsp:Transcript_5232/g.11044  ORF Transcript_5232/g.11044 Transcript_5232/m.11044 type:complete len:214 (-) Transcript_5232:291-932(-)